MVATNSLRSIQGQSRTDYTRKQGAVQDDRLPSTVTTARKPLEVVGLKKYSPPDKSLFTLPAYQEWSWLAAFGSKCVLYVQS